MEITFNGYYTLIFATLVLLLGRFLVKRVKFLSEFNIPEPVAGGFVAAVIIYILHMVWGYSFSFKTELQTVCMLMFFASIGLSADFSRLKAGGKPLVIFLILVSSYILVQNFVGVSIAKLLNLDPLIGLVAGSISLVGGHGTAGAWGVDLETKYGLVSATALGIACATYGLVAGGLIGGPVAKRLIKNLNVKPFPTSDHQTAVEKLSQPSPDGTQPVENKDRSNKDVFERPDNIRLITATSTIETLTLFAMALVFADVMTTLTAGTKYQLPTFVFALGGGVIIRNTLTTFSNFDMFDRAIDVFGNASLSLFLAMALLNLKLWQLTDLALPILVILGVQTLVMIGFAYFVTFRVMGKNYDSAILAAGHCGFGMGATPTAIANMQAITDRYGPSPKAFLIVPLVGAFFVDIINTLILHGFTKIL